MYTVPRRRLRDTAAHVPATGQSVSNGGSIAARLERIVRRAAAGRAASEAELDRLGLGGRQLPSTQAAS